MFEFTDTPVTDENGSPISIVWKPDRMYLFLIHVISKCNVFNT